MKWAPGKEHLLVVALADCVDRERLERLRLRRPCRLQRRSAGGTDELPLPPGKLLVGTRLGRLQDVFRRTAVEAFAVNGHRGRNDDLLELGAHVHRRLEDDRRAHCVHGGIPLDLVHRLAYTHGGGKMHESIHAVQGPLHRVAVADVALDPFDIGGQIVRPAVVNLRIERVEHPHVVAARKQAIDEMRADEAGATCDQDMHLAGG